MRGRFTVTRTVLILSILGTLLPAARSSGVPDTHRMGLAHSSTRPHKQESPETCERGSCTSTPLICMSVGLFGCRAGRDIQFAFGKQIVQIGAQQIGLSRCFAG